MRPRFDKVEVTPGFWLFSGILFLWLPLSQGARLLGAALIHEAGHLLAAHLCGGAFQHLRLGFFGWEMDLERERLPYRRQIAVDLAGPGANALACVFLLLLIRARPTQGRLFFFFCNALYGAIQLLPVSSLDGGRALTAALSLFCARETAEKAVRVVGAVTGAMALAAGIILFWQTGNPSPALFLPGAALTNGGKRAKKAEKTSAFSAVLRSDHLTALTFFAMLLFFLAAVFLWT